MRRVDLLITASREATENTNFSPDTGIQDSEFIQYLNDGQDRIFGALLSVHPLEFLVPKVIDAVARTSIYSIPSDCYLGSKIKQVEYSIDGQESTYYTLDKGVERERLRTQAGIPGFYIRRANKVILNPPPAAPGFIRFTYTQKLPRLDKRRGKVSAVTLDSATKTITALTIDVTTNTPDDIAEIIDNGYITIVDKDGSIQMQDIPISSIDTSTGVVTLDGAFTYVSGETIAVNNWLVIGKYASTQSSLDDSCERYLLAHCNWKILKRDSSNDSVESNDELTSMLAEIVNIYKDADDDINFVPILDTDYLTFS